ncbi:MAG: T9SS type A sorting domain-containing protein [Bacteroidetes bacterium]|nr:T9SS type A sorting domain-containing protein [Bacteroidota bacterium]
MLRNFFIFILFFTARSVAAQDSLISRTWGKLGVKINSVGSLGFVQKPAVEYPAASGKFALNRLAFWVTALGKGSDTLVACEETRSIATHWCEGPYGSGGQHVSGAEWPRILQISARDVQDHRSHYKDAGYTPLSSITNWPGSFSKPGFPARCAPFADVNANQKYDPLQGDYPYLPGSDNVWAMGSDSLNKSNLKTLAMPVDISAIWFKPAGSDTLLQYTAWARITVCNRGADTLHNCRTSLVADFQLGNSEDNYLGTHVTRQSIYSFNGPANDAVYGPRWPVVSAGWLSGKTSSSIYYEAGGDAVKGQPVRAAHFYHFANGCWKTGSSLGYGGSGLDITFPASYVYSNGTDPAFTGKPAWNEDSAGNIPGHRTGILSTSAVELLPGACRVSDAHVTVIPDKPDSARLSVFLKGITELYGNSDFSLGKKRVTKPQLRVYPNPVQSGHTLSALLQEGEIYLTDMQGKVLLKLKKGENILPQLSAGIYIIRTNTSTPVLLQIL